MSRLLAVALQLSVAVGCNQRPPSPEPTVFDPASEGLQPPFGSCDPPLQSVDPNVVAVFINEAFAGSLQDELKDWLEIHNAGRTPVPLKGWVIEDHYTDNGPKGAPGRYEFPPDTFICPLAFHVVARAKGCEATTADFDFGIGSTDRLTLTNLAGEVVDDVQWADLPAGQSVGRADDSSDAFHRLLEPTPGASNLEECRCCGECLVGRCTEQGGACVARTDADCSASEGCIQLGWCALGNGRCVAATEADCRQSAFCRSDGKCGLRGGACEVIADEDCRAAKVCENDGRCTADLALATCVATSDADCAASDDCSRKNRCSLQGGRCVATSCNEASVCQDPRQMCCDLVDGKCVRL